MMKPSKHELQLLVDKHESTTENRIKKGFEQFLGSSYRLLHFRQSEVEIIYVALGLGAFH